MQLSDFTLEILENFININEGIVIYKDKREGNGTQIRTISANHENPTTSTTMTAKVIVPEVFENDICISDLRQFSNVIKATKNPDFNFEENYVSIKGNNLTTNITYARPTEIIHEYEGYPKAKGATVQFTLSSEDMRTILKLCDTLQLQHLKVDVENGNVIVSAINKDNPDVKSSHINLGTTESTDEDIKSVLPLYFERSAFKLLPFDYEVTLCRGLGWFTNKENNLEYAITSENVYE